MVISINVSEEIHNGTKQSISTRNAHLSLRPAIYFLDRFPSMNFCERLNALSFRCVQPIQQQGRRMPSLSSERTRSTCSWRFSGLFTEIVQQIHSLRASGVISSHFARALGSEARAFFKSEGSGCVPPPEIFFSMDLVYYEIICEIQQRLLSELFFYSTRLALRPLGCPANPAQALQEKPAFLRAFLSIPFYNAPIRRTRKGDGRIRRSHSQSREQILDPRHYRSSCLPCAALPDQ